MERRWAWPRWLVGWTFYRRRQLLLHGFHRNGCKGLPPNLNYIHSFLQLVFWLCRLPLSPWMSLILNKYQFFGNFHTWRGFCSPAVGWYSHKSVKGCIECKALSFREPLLFDPKWGKRQGFITVKAQASPFFKALLAAWIRIKESRFFQYLT